MVVVTVPKPCTKCGKPRDARRTWCNACMRKYRAENRDRLNANRRKRYYEDHENKLRQAARSRTQRTEARRAALRAYCAEWRARNTDRANQSNRDYYRRNRDEVLTRQYLRDLRRTGKITAADVLYPEWQRMAKRVSTAEKQRRMAAHKKAIDAAVKEWDANGRRGPMPGTIEWERQDDRDLYQDEIDRQFNARMKWDGEE